MKNFKIIIFFLIAIFNNQLKAQTDDLERISSEAKILYTELSLKENNPLYTINGIAIKYGDEVLSAINPQDIQSINVLKDVEGKIKHGDKAVNGVLEITLKKTAANKYKKFLQNNTSDIKFDKKDYRVSISGIITDSKNQPVSKAVISNLIKRESYYSDSLGIYKINVALNDYISFSKDNFESQKLKVTSQMSPNIILKAPTASSKILIRKPVIYLYPTKKTDISFSFNFKGELLTTFPNFENNWNIIAYPDGKIFDKKTNRFYNSLFWDGIQIFPDRHYQYQTGFTVEKQDLTSFLIEKLEHIGLNVSETNDFIQYWLPLLEQNDINFIHFYVNSDYDIFSTNNLTPKPDTSIRVFMEFYGVDHKIEIQKQNLPKTERRGFTLVEWGGANVSTAIKNNKNLKL